LAATQTTTAVAATQTQAAIEATSTATELPASATSTRVPRRSRTPRASPTRQLFVEPTLVKPGITVRPAATPAASSAGQVTPETGADLTEVASATESSTATLEPGATAESTEPNPESIEETGPTSTLVIRRATATPDSTSAVGGIVSGASPLVAVALLAFVGAAVLGIAALFVWRK
jgi:hypothetical protein